MNVQIITCPCQVCEGEGCEVPADGGLAREATADATIAHNLVRLAQSPLGRMGQHGGPWPIGTHSIPAAL
ncbi:hypothetical protein JOL79_06760 [Microbispora sp. RL4-1S]|uniref:Uncharacterized protein n=1 Tax=Microbispora oryzae TaxID=2806554 RepID=A0A941AIU2_9ACTN|nr:hypothetical protein [Microbispora oryzae]MBP2703498.1 hypothetical protein [Microbispora oryzae]